MNKRIEILKKVARFSKRKKFPKKLIVIELTSLLLLMYFGGMIKKIIYKFIKLIFPNKWTVIAYFTIGIILGVFVLPYKNMIPEEDRAYGNDVQSIEKIDLNKLPMIGNNVASSGELPLNSIKQNNESDNNENNYNNGQNSINNDQTDINDGQTIQYTDEQLRNMQFLIRVNRQQNCITIYTTDENGDYSVPVKAMLCSTGGESTPLGTYSVREKYVFRKLLYDVYGQYATRIVDQILFHSSSYAGKSKDTLLPEEFNKLGTPASHGCIRLTTQDAKWIYDYCRWGTIVEIYDGDYPGPLGKPEVVKLPEDTVWDPTDIDENNVWNNAVPVINAEDRSIKRGEKFNPLEGVTAIDTCGNDITDKMVITEQVNEFILGDYQVNYFVCDLLGRTVQKTITITVE